MKFYDREKELDLIAKANRVAVVGRRRVGKTRFLKGQAKFYTKLKKNRGQASFDHI